MADNQAATADAASETTTPTSAAAVIPTVQQVQQAVGQAQAQQAAAKKQPLTGTELAEKISEIVPKAPKPGQRYRIAEYREAPDGTDLGNDNSVIVTSADGSPEDAVRAFNAGRKDIRTFKQLRVEFV